MGARARPARLAVAHRACGAVAHRHREDVRPADLTLEGRTLSGSRRRGKNLLFPTEDGKLILRVHLMSAGRLRYHPPGAKTPKTPMFRLSFVDGGELVLTEAGKKRRAGVWLFTPEGWTPSSHISGPARRPVSIQAATPGPAWIGLTRRPLRQKRRRSALSATPERINSGCRRLYLGREHDQEFQIY